MSGYAHVRNGSIASFWSSADYFRSSPGNGHCQGRSPCLKSAKSAMRDRIRHANGRPGSLNLNFALRELTCSVK